MISRHNRSATPLSAVFHKWPPPQAAIIVKARSVRAKQRGYLWLFFLCMASSRVLAGEPSDPLERKIPDSFSCTSFDDALRAIEQSTGLHVSCPDELAVFMRTILIKFSFHGPSDVTVKKFLDGTCEKLSLGWQCDPKNELLVLDLPWKTHDPRSAAALLRFVWQSGGGDLSENVKWQAAFNALISCDGNLETAWKVRQKAALKDLVVFARHGIQPKLMQRMISATGEKYILVLICQPILMYPGSGSASYYWFKEDGCLVGAGLMDTGHRCKLIDAAIDSEYGGWSSGNTSEVHMILKWNERAFYVARFVLEPTGLRLTHLTDSYGKEANNKDFGVGDSLMSPDPQSSL